MEGEPSRPYDRTPLLAGAAVAVLIALVAAIDFRAVLGDVPRVPPPCVPPAEPECNAARNAQLQDRIVRAEELEDDYGGRAWAYGAAALASVLGGAGVALARTAAGQRRELFTDLGVAGVVWMLGGFILATVVEGEIVDVPAKPIFYPGIVLLAIASVGTLATRRAKEVAGAPAPREPRGGPAVRAAGLGLTAVSVLAAAIAFGDRGDPCQDAVSDTVETMLAIAWIAAGLAILAGLVSLVQRRWLAALAMLAVGPFCALFAAFATACWN